MFVLQLLIKRTENENLYFCLTLDKVEFDSSQVIELNCFVGQLLWNRWSEEWVVLYDDSTMAWFTVYKLKDRR